jgi:hypothetical protein
MLATRSNKREVGSRARFANPGHPSSPTERSYGGKNDAERNHDDSVGDL